MYSLPKSNSNIWESDELYGRPDENGKLKSAQPLDIEGVIVSGTAGKPKDGPFNATKGVIAGYFLIEAKDLDESVQIARKNPVCEGSSMARIEVRPIKVLKGYMRPETTGQILRWTGFSAEHILLFVEFP